MSLSPNKHRTLSRQASSPSLAVGLPPALPESNIMTPSFSSHKLKRIHSRPRLHRGDGSSSANSSPCGTHDEGEHEPNLNPVTPCKNEFSAPNTPKRRVLGTIEVIPFGTSVTGKKRDTLMARLDQVAKVEKSKSTGDSLNASPNLASRSFRQAAEGRTAVTTDTTVMSGSTASTSDKVVVCVRSVQSPPSSRSSAPALADWKATLII